MGDDEIRNEVVEVKAKSRNMDWFLAILTVVLISGFMVLIAALFLRSVPDGNKEILVYMAGQLSGFASAAIALWTNTTHSSSVKTDVISQSTPVKL